MKRFVRGPRPLLTTIEEAQKDGWDVLHAIVDCVWLSDLKGRTQHQQRVDAEAFGRRISEQVGIPLEFEAHYDFIAFLPSRVHGSGSLTKYWAYDGDSFKVRGIEMRQHSTPVWIQRLQQAGLECLAAGERNDGIPSFAHSALFCSITEGNFNGCRRVKSHCVNSSLPGEPAARWGTIASRT